MIYHRKFYWWIILLAEKARIGRHRMVLNYFDPKQLSLVSTFVSICIVTNVIVITVAFYIIIIPRKISNSYIVDYMTKQILFKISDGRCCERSVAMVFVYKVIIHHYVMYEVLFARWNSSKNIWDFFLHKMAFKNTDNWFFFAFKIFSMQVMSFGVYSEQLIAI